MEIQEFMALIGLGLGLAAFIWNEFSKLGAKIDADMKAQSERTDKLYEMFIDLLKERK